MFSSDGKYVAAAGVGSILVWDASTQQEIIRIPSSDYVYSLTWSADGHYVVTAHLDHTVRIWEVSTGREISRLMEEGTIPSMAMSPDGRYLAAGGELAVRVWDLVTGQKVARLAAEDGITAVAFSPDGKYVITGGGRTARVWEVSSGQELARILHERVLSVAFSSDGEYALSGSYFDTVRVWKWHPEALIADACSRLTRNLTRMEWQQYIGNALPYQAVCPDLPIEPESIFIPHTPTPTVLP